MPEICRFYGIVIKMYFADHVPPHFHAEYAEHEARIAIDTLAVISGQLPCERWDSWRSGRRSTNRSCRPHGQKRVDWSNFTVLIHCLKARRAA